MEPDDNKKPMTLDDLAAMVAEGFANTPNKAEFDQLTKEVNTLNHSIDALKSNVNNYLELSKDAIQNLNSATRYSLSGSN